MKKLMILLQVIGWEWLAAQHQTSTLDEPHLGGSIPYTVDIREVSLSPTPLPNIHSVAAGKWEGQWVFLAGRTNGLHGMTGRGAFDPLYENRMRRRISSRTS